MLGDWLTYVAIGVLALRSDGGGLEDLALVQLAYALPQVLGAPLAGWLADRVDRRRLIASASLVRGLLTLAMALAAFRGALGLVEGLLFLRMAGAAFVSAPSSALVPRLVAAEDVASANALLGVAWSVVFSVGVVLGGAVSALVGPVVALAADALTFALAALIVLRLELPSAPVETRPALPSLAADARAHPDRLRVAALKTPAQLVSGAAFVAMHGLALTLAPSRVALTLGGLHALRGISSGLAPWALRTLVPAERQAELGSLLAVAGLGALAMAVKTEAPAWAIASVLLWGSGVGASWVGGASALQRAVPGAVLGRYAALDVTLAALASAIGGVGFAALTALAGVPLALAAVALLGALLLLVLSARSFGERRSRSVRWVLALLAVTQLALPSSALAQPAAPWLEAALEARALTDDDFARTEVYSWTTEAQAGILAQDGRLLRAGANDGRSRSPYQRALDELAVSRAADPDDVALARLLSTDPALASRRYAWTTPYGAVLPRGQRSYGPILVRIELDPGAWQARFAPEERPAFRVVDAAGAPVPVEDVLASPSRLASVVHVRAHDRHGAFREIIVHGGVARWSIGTPAIAARIEEDRRVLAGLRRALAAGAPWRPRPFAPSWRTRGAAPHGLAALFAASMPFDTARHRLRDEALAALEAAMADRARLRVSPLAREITQARHDAPSPESSDP